MPATDPILRAHSQACSEPAHRSVNSACSVLLAGFRLGARWAAQDAAGRSRLGVFGWRKGTRSSAWAFRRGLRGCPR